MDMTWLEKARNRTAWLLLLALFWCGSHHVAPKWDYMCMKQEVGHSPTIHQSLGGPVLKFVHVYSAGTLTVLMRVWMCKGVIKCVGVQYESVCVCVSCEGWGGEQTGPPHFSLSIILHARHTRGDMPERVSISCVCVCVCLCACAAVFTQGMQFIIFVCVSGYYIQSPHTCMQGQMEPEG